uniref:Murine leukemia virus integrase C-terminal domain-containing protein n=1 Tax=Knipowitschia caucasica TaxID=637954 RepID=A0AAV2MDK6_KNICA
MVWVVDWTTGMGPTADRHSLEGWVKGHQKALNHAYEVAKQKTELRQENDRTLYDRRAKLAPLLPGERVLIRNFRRRAGGKLSPRWNPELYVVVAPLRKDHPVYVICPEGKDSPTRTIHRNNLRLCPLNVLEPSQESTTPEAAEPKSEMCQPPPTWWLQNW